MCKVKNLFLFTILSLLFVSKSSACHTIMVSDFMEKIKAEEGEFKIKESNGGFYIHPSLLALKEDGIHLVFGENDLLIPSIFHDTKGYFLSPEACHDLGNRWICCRCNKINDMWADRCSVCLNKRCGT